MDQTLQERISSTFKESGVHDFLLQIQHGDVFEFICGDIISKNSNLPAEDITVILDPRSAVQTKTLKTLGHAANIYVCGSSDSKAGTFPEQTVMVPESPISLHDRFLILMTSKASYLVFYSVDQQDFMNTVINRGCWSFHRDAIESIAHYVTMSDTIKAPAAAESTEDYPVSPVSMGILSKLAKYIENQQHDAVTLKNDFALVLDILKQLSVRRSVHEILYVFTDQIATTVKADRCSVVRVWEHENTAHVLASHEDKSVDDVVIDLNKYPEVKATLDAKSKSIINNVRTDPVTKDVAEQLESMGITSILVVPIVLDNENVGSFLLRTIKKGGSFTQRESDFCSIVCEAAANAIERADLFETIQKTNRSLERLATTDSLTGLYNRRYFITRIEEEIARTARYCVPMCCLLIDIDNFKKVNDTYGHLVGDEVLRSVADLTEQTVRTNDVVARYGGEELIILLPQTELVGARQQAERLLKRISSEKYNGLPDDHPITISIGVAINRADENLTADDFIKRADEALYEAKEGGKNRYIIYGKEG